MTALQSPAAGVDPDKAPESELVRRVRDGDSAAFAVIMQRHNRMLYRIARSILGDSAEAEDALQEGYLRAYQAIGSFAGRSRLSTWLMRIVANEALGRRRRRLARGEETARPAESLEPPEAVILPFGCGTRSDDPEAFAARGEIRRLVEQAIDELPTDFRAVFMLRAIEELSVADTADCLGIAPETVKTRFHRAKRRLRQALDRQLDAVLADSFPFGGERCANMVAAVLARIDAQSHGAEGAKTPET